MPCHVKNFFSLFFSQSHTSPTYLHKHSNARVSTELNPRVHFYQLVMVIDVYLSTKKQQRIVGHHTRLSNKHLYKIIIIINKVFSDHTCPLSLLSFFPQWLTNCSLRSGLHLFAFYLCRFDLFAVEEPGTFKLAFSKIN